LLFFANFVPISRVFANVYFLEAGLLSFLHPLTGGLGLLILAVEVLVDFLLLTVTALLDTLLTGLAIGLGGLNL
jgi:hypothetical protein